MTLEELQQARGIDRQIEPAGEQEEQQRIRRKAGAADERDAQWLAQRRGQARGQAIEGSADHDLPDRRPSIASS